jgi:hypothetical protein
MPSDTTPTWSAHDVVNALYSSLLARSPEGDEEADMVELLERGGSVEDVVRCLLSSPECRMSFYRNDIFDDVVFPEPLPVDVPRLYLWHVPKTGGTSLREMLRPHFDQMEFCGGLTVSELYRMSGYRLRSFRVFAGHYGPTLPQLLPEVPLVTATLIRDPVGMVESLYGHWRDLGDPGHPQTELARRLPFEKWCRSEASRGLWRNPQARSMCNHRIPPTRQEAVVDPEGTSTFVPADQLLDEASIVLGRIDVVGTTNDLLAVYRACLGGLGMEPTLTRALTENVGAGTQAQVSPSTRDWLMEQNWADAYLFEQAKLRGANLGAQTSAPVLQPIRPTNSVVSGHDRRGQKLRPAAEDPDQESLIPGWSPRRVLILSACVSAVIAAWDASVREVLIGLLAIGPCCAILAGRWRSTAVVGAWAILLAAVMGIRDGIWATAAYALFLSAIAATAIAATLATALIERRYDRVISTTG